MLCFLKMNGILCHSESECYSCQEHFSYEYLACFQNLLVRLYEWNCLSQKWASQWEISTSWVSSILYLIVTISLINAKRTQQNWRLYAKYWLSIIKLLLDWMKAKWLGRFEHSVFGQVTFHSTWCEIMHNASPQNAFAVSETKSKCCSPE